MSRHQKQARGCLTQSLYVPLSLDVMDSLSARATEQRRAPRDEAAVIIETALGIRKEPARVLTLAPDDARWKREEPDGGDEEAGA